MTTAKEPLKCKIIVNNEIIEQVMATTSYLWAPSTSSERTHQELEKQLTKASTVVDVYKRFNLVE